MTATTTPAVRSEYTGVINARDFSPITTDPQRDAWTWGKMHHLIKALDGRLVAITTDTGTGGTLFNVTLNSVHKDRVTTTYVYNDDGGQTVTSYLLFMVGMVMVMPTGKHESVGSDAWRSYQAHVSAAIDIAKEKHGDTRKWGVWEGDVLNGREVYVTYTPHTGNDAMADQWGEPGSWRIGVEG